MAPTAAQIERMKLHELMAELGQRGLPTAGSRCVLMSRLVAAVHPEEFQGQGRAAPSAFDVVPASECAGDAAATGGVAMGAPVAGVTAQDAALVPVSTPRRRRRVIDEDEVDASPSLGTTPPSGQVASPRDPVGQLIGQLSEGRKDELVLSHLKATAPSQYSALLRAAVAHLGTEDERLERDGSDAYRPRRSSKSSPIRSLPRHGFYLLHSQPGLALCSTCCPLTPRGTHATPRASWRLAGVKHMGPSQSTKKNSWRMPSGSMG